jgi:hypothetical protein
MCNLLSGNKNKKEELLAFYETKKGFYNNIPPHIIKW